jgi:hypothetical protein
MPSRRAVTVLALTLSGALVSSCQKPTAVTPPPRSVVEAGKSYRFSWGLLEFHGTVVSTDGCWATVNGIPHQSRGMAGAPDWAEHGQVKLNVCTVSIIQEFQSGE